MASVADVASKGVAQSVKSNVAQGIKDKFDWTTLKEKFDFSQQQIVEMATYLGIGFFTGFLFKKYARYFLISIVLIVFALKYFQTTGLVTFHWDQIQTTLTANNITGVEQVFYTCVDWVKANVAISISFSIGFIFGYNVG